MVVIPERVKVKIRFVADYIGNTTDCWPTIKERIASNLRRDDRSLFSYRHPVTKQQIPNEFDIEVMKFWKELTGVTPIIPPHKLYNPNDPPKKSKAMVLACMQERWKQKIEARKKGTTQT